MRGYTYKHSISFVKNKVGDTLKVRDSSINKINKSAGGCHKYFDSLLQLILLFRPWHTSVDCCSSDLASFCKFLSFLLDLKSQFSCGCQNEYDRPITRFKEFLSVNMDDCWKYKGKSFARSSVCNSNHVSAAQHYWPWLALDWSWLLELWLELLNQVPWEAAICEVRNRGWNVLSVVYNLKLRVTFKAIHFLWTWIEVFFEGFEDNAVLFPPRLLFGQSKVWQLFYHSFN
jgi:hypothetical protein